MAKAIALLSGGLDSMLAVRLMLEQGIEVEALHFVSVFNCGPKAGGETSAEKAARALGVPLKFIDFTAVQMEILRDPPHGYGSAANPCIDCHMAMLLRAFQYMKETGADFIVTGEVVGQRPMSQRVFALRLIDRETGLGGYILRPLSARALEPTVPEKQGLVDRERLEGITGRTRTRQMELAKQFGLNEYPSPAGGCLLTDREFGRRVKDLVAHDELDPNNAHLIKVGRHYRLDDRTKVIVGRNEQENEIIEKYAHKGDVIFKMADIMGPTALLRGEATTQSVIAAAALTARSSKSKAEASAKLRARTVGDDKETIIEVAPATDEFAAALTLSRGDVTGKSGK